MLIFNSVIFKSFRSVLIVIFIFIISSAHVSAQQQLQLKSVSSLKYLNCVVLPHDLDFKGTTVGGLSGIDFDQQTKTYYLISDDRSHHNPSRFYTAKINVSAAGIDSVYLTGVHSLRQQDGSTYPEKILKGTKTADPEALRYNPLNKTVIWTSEGDRDVDSADTILIDPTITIVSSEGKYIDSIPLPDNLRMHAFESGPRNNGVLEGITYADNFNSIYVSLEEPLYQDGPQATLVRNHPFIRIYKFDTKTKSNTAQYAYELEPVAFPAVKEGDGMNNGVSDILSIGKNQLMVTERSYGNGRQGTNIKVFIADFSHAQNILHTASLLAAPAAQPVQKKLLLNMDALGIYIDNIEGATIGPVLPNGHQTVIFMADNNFKKIEQSQFLIFEVIP